MTDAIHDLTIRMLAEADCDVASRHDGRTLGSVDRGDVIPDNWAPASPAAAALAVGLFVERWLGNCLWMADAPPAVVARALNTFRTEQREAGSRATRLGFVSETRCAALNVRAASAALAALHRYPEVWPHIAGAIRDHAAAGQARYAAYQAGVAADPTYAERWAADESIRPIVPPFADLLHAALDARWPDWRAEPLFP